MNEVKKFTDVITKLASDVYGHLGDGFSEDIYQKALAYELRENKIDYLRETVIELFYKDQMVGLGEIDFYFPAQKKAKFELKNPLILETKYTTKLDSSHRAQLRQYLLSGKQNQSKLLSNLNTGLLLNWQKKADYSEKRIAPDSPVECEIWTLSKQSFKKL